MPCPPFVVILLMIALFVSATAGESSDTDHRGINRASSPHFMQKSDRLEAIRRYILHRLNVSDNRRFNGSAPLPPSPSTLTRLLSPDHHHRGLHNQQAASTQSFRSLPEALNFYAKESTQGAARSPLDDSVQRRRRRLKQNVDESGSTEEQLQRRGTSRRRSATKRGRRKHVKLTLTADTGQSAEL